jgi:SAM-dependent methyltransferase
MGIAHKIHLRLRRKLCRPDREFLSARAELLASDKLTPEEKILLGEVSLKIHPKDEMYVPTGARHYLHVGLSALRCIEKALDASPQEGAIRSILDFPCGYGRVLRFIRARFPDAAIAAGETNLAALDFCEEEFQARPVVSTEKFSDVERSGPFDLIWCGSLLTHIPEEESTELLRLFFDSLAPGGRCVFTTHGEVMVKEIGNQSKTRALTKSSRNRILSGYAKEGYGYADYRGCAGYGLSLSTCERIRTMAREVGQWNEVMCWESGWDNRQDVFAWAKPNSGLPDS